MFNKTELDKALDIQERSYRLFLWLETAIDRGFIATNKAHEYANAADAAYDWIKDHIECFPPEGRPISTKNKDLVPFANYFSTYLLTSFEIVENPGERWRNKWKCCCTLCNFLGMAPHLQTIKIDTRMKKRAQKLKYDYLHKLAFECEFNLGDEALEALVLDKTLKEDLAIATYSDQLLQRLLGYAKGPAVLALWREFTRNESGAVKKKFKLKSSIILNAEKRLVERLREIN